MDSVVLAWPSDCPRSAYLPWYRKARILRSSCEEGICWAAARDMGDMGHSQQSLHSLVSTCWQRWTGSMWVPLGGS